MQTDNGTPAMLGLCASCGDEMISFSGKQVPGAPKLSVHGTLDMQPIFISVRPIDTVAAVEPAPARVEPPAPVEPAAAPVEPAPAPIEPPAAPVGRAPAAVEPAPAPGEPPPAPVEPPAAPIGRAPASVEPAPATAELASITSVKGIGPKLAEQLVKRGITSLEALAAALPKQVADVKGISEAQAAEFIAQARKLIR